MSSRLNFEDVFNNLVNPALAHDREGVERWGKWDEVDDLKKRELFERSDRLREKANREIRIADALAYLGDPRSDGYQDRLLNIRNMYTAIRQAEAGNTP